MNDANPYGAPKASSQILRWSAQESTISLILFLAAFYGLGIVWGVKSVTAQDPSIARFLCDATLSLCLGLWAVADARQRQAPIPRSAQMWFLLFAVVVVPGYVIVTRGWKGLGWVVVHGVAWMTLSTAAMHFTGWSRYGDLWLQTMFG